MPIPSDYRDIVASLLTKTDNGRVHWTRGRFGIEVEVEKSIFTLWAGTDENSEQAFVAFSLNDANGSTLDSWYVDENDEDYDLMRRFFAAAKRYAHGIPQRLSFLKESIASLGYIGQKQKK
jgi:hypothetical protein